MKLSGRGLATTIIIALAAGQLCVIGLRISWILFSDKKITALKKVLLNQKTKITNNNYNQSKEKSQ